MIAERQSRAVPAASTMVVASTASTAHARKTEANTAQTVIGKPPWNRTVLRYRRW